MLSYAHHQDAAPNISGWLGFFLDFKSILRAYAVERQCISSIISEKLDEDVTLI
jgi:hypothetical protein